MKSKNITNPGIAELMQALSFTDADLKANREGYLSQRQRRQIMLNTAGYIAIAGVFIALMSLWYLDGRPGSGGVHWLVSACLTSIYGLAFLGLIRLVFWFQSNMKKDLQNPPVVYRVVIHKSQTVKHRSLYFADKDIHVSGEVYEAFKEGGKYEIYYAPRTDLLLCAVPLKPDAPHRMN